MRNFPTIAAFAGLCLAIPSLGQTSPYAAWSNGPSTNPNYFPIGVWLQSPANAARYQAIGINLYVGLYTGPTTADLNTLNSAGMQTICEQSADALTWIKNNPTNKTIVGWTQQDEPDNAQPDASGYGPPVLPSSIVATYNSMKANDATRPIYLNLGQAVGWDPTTSTPPGTPYQYYGRGSVGLTAPYDESNYIPGSDIASFDIYPYNSTDSQIHAKPSMVAWGVTSLAAWTAANRQQPVWNDIETTNINGTGGPMPIQTKAEVWMSLVHGSMGITYFAHVLAPTFDETGLLDNAPMAAEVKSIDAQILSLAPALNSPTVAGTIVGTPLATSSNPAVSIDTMEKDLNSTWYLFAVQMADGSATATYKLTGLPAHANATDLDSGAVFSVRNGQFQDTFSGYEATPIHEYEIVVAPEPGALGLTALSLGSLLRRRRRQRQSWRLSRKRIFV